MFVKAEVSICAILDRQIVKNRVAGAERRRATGYTESARISSDSIRGTPAFATVGPDLTHLASRGSIAAGTLGNNRGNLAGWVTDAQHVKPGSYMPSINIAAPDVQPLVDYLESLK